MPNQGGFHEKHVQAGQQSHKNETLSAKLPAKKDRKESERGEKGNFADDRQHAFEAGRKGGKH